MVLRHHDFGLPRLERGVVHAAVYRFGRQLQSKRADRIHPKPQQDDAFWVSGVAVIGLPSPASRPRTVSRKPSGTMRDFESISSRATTISAARS